MQERVPDVMAEGDDSRKAQRGRGSLSTPVNSSRAEEQAQTCVLTPLTVLHFFITSATALEIC